MYNICLICIQLLSVCIFLYDDQSLILLVMLTINIIFIFNYHNQSIKLS